MRRNLYGLRNSSLLAIGLTILAIGLSTAIVGSCLLLTLGKSDNLACKRVEWHYVTCQRQTIHFYGLWSDSTASFRLQGVAIEDYQKDSDDGFYTAYTLQLKTATEQIEFHDYNRDQEQADADMRRIHDVLSGFAKPDLSLKRGSPWSEDLIIAAATIVWGWIWFSVLSRSCLHASSSHASSSHTKSRKSR